VIRANERIRHALRDIRTADVEVSYHCLNCKGYNTGNVATRRLRHMTCRCGSNDLLLLSVAPEVSSPLLGSLLPARAG
jgi:hypothetical protein